MNFKKIVQKLINHFKTNNPFLLGELLGVVVRDDQPLGRIKGVYKLMQPTTNCHFLANYTLISVDKIEIEANRFCAYLLLSDNELAEYHGLTYKEISRLACIPVEIIKLRQAKATLA